MPRNGKNYISPYKKISFDISLIYICIRNYLLHEKMKRKIRELKFPKQGRVERGFLIVSYFLVCALSTVDVCNCFNPLNFKEEKNYSNLEKESSLFWDNRWEYLLPAPILFNYELKSQENESFPNNGKGWKRGNSLEVLVRLISHTPHLFLLLM